MKYIVDSNVLIDYAGEIIPKAGLNLLDPIFDEGFSISIITKIEVLGYNDKKRMEAMNNLISFAILYHTSDQISEIAIDIRRKRKIKLPDAIIAATAIANNLTIITHNISDFQNIKGLKILDPWNI